MPVIDLIKVKPIVAVPVSNEEIAGNTEVAAQLVKILNTDTSKVLDTTKFISVVKSEKTSTTIYTIKTVDTNNQTISIEVMQNPLTNLVKVIDVSKVN